MAEINIMKENQKKNKSISIWDYLRFSELMRFDPKAAAQYAIDCWVKTEIYGVPVEEYVKNPVWEDKIEDKVVKDEISEPIVEEKDEEIESEETELVISVTDLKELLKANGIKHHHALGKEKLVKLAQENGLM